MLNCIIVDDEHLAIQLLSDYVSKTEGLELAASFENPIEAIQFCSDNDVDLVFLDVQMPELTGIQFMKILKGKTHFILTTAYDQYALEGYDFDIIDYLLKPITLERFIISVQKAKERLNPIHQDIQVPTAPATPDYIFVKTEYKVRKINLSDILYFEGLGDYVNIQTKEGKVLTLESIRKFVERLPEKEFIRVHKSYIIPIRKIEYIEKNRIVIGEKYIPIGGTYQKGFWERIHPKQK